MFKSRHKIKKEVDHLKDEVSRLTKENALQRLQRDEALERHIELQRSLPSGDCGIHCKYCKNGIEHIMTIYEDTDPRQNPSTYFCAVKMKENCKSYERKDKQA